MDWAQPVAIIGGAVAIVGWFVAYLLRIYESAHGSRRAIYSKVLAPTAECLSVLRHAKTLDRRTWLEDNEPRFDACLVKLSAAIGEVDLIRKRKVSWSAVVLGETLEKARGLAEAEHHKADDDRPLYRSAVERLYEESVQARDDFLLTAGRSLEPWIHRRFRDLESGRKKRVKRIASESRAAAEARQARQGARAASLSEPAAQPSDEGAAGTASVTRSAPVGPPRG